MRSARGASALIALALIAGLAFGCALRAEHTGGEAAIDSSFAAVTASRGRAPLELSLMSGKATYDRYCLICHGESGGGDGFNAYNVKSAFGVSPTAFSDSAAMAALPESVALTSIREGGVAAGKSAAMPPWGHTLTPGEIADVWRYARSLAGAGGR